MLGALLIFSFLTMQPFNLELDRSVWRQILGHKMQYEDLIQYELVEEGLDDEQEIEERVENYFGKFSRQIRAI